MKIYILCVLLLIGCSKEAEQQIKSSNSNFKVELLFETDGCKVYRFYDAGYPRYFSNCQGSISWQEKHGKTSSMINIPTN